MDDVIDSEENYERGVLTDLCIVCVEATCPIAFNKYATKHKFSYFLISYMSGEGLPILEDVDLCVGKIKGIWYTMYLDGHDFDFIGMDEDGETVLINTKFEELFYSILQFYINQSPRNEICLILRLQREYLPGIIEVHSMDDMKKKMDRHQIKFNQAYYIRQEN